MRAEVRFTIPELEPSDLAGVTAVVVDVIRATTTMITALGNGARSVLPVASTEDALRLAQSLGRDDTLLCGERKGLRIEGFDLGNSPLEFTRPVVEDKRLVMTTTNGTRAFVAAEGADTVIALAFINLEAVADAVAEADRLLVLCAGRQDAFALEDAVCAGWLLKVLEGRGVALDMNDGARAAMELCNRFEVNEAFLDSTSTGQVLVEAGLGLDLVWCVQRDGMPVVPVLKDGVLVSLDPRAL